MKKSKRIIGLLLSLVMLIAMAIPVSAAGDTTYTITINNEKAGHEYGAYQVFAGDLSEGVLSNIVWGSGVNGTTLLTALQETDTYSACANAADVAVELAKANAAEVEAFAVIVGAHLKSSPTGEVKAKPYEISGLSAGYYLVKDTKSVTGSDAQTRFILKVVGNVSVDPKFAVPTLEKKVKENDQYVANDGYGAGYNDVADYTIGDKVPFKLIGTVPDMKGYTSYQYTFHDTMSAGLTLDSDSIHVYLASAKNTDLSEATLLIQDTHYTLPSNNHCTFEVSFAALNQVPNVAAGKYIIVTYNATLNSNAIIGLEGNPNEAYLQFSNNPNAGGGEDTGSSPVDKAIVFTYQLDTTKVDGANADTKLSGAEFVLFNSAQNKVAIVSGGKITSWAAATTEATNWPEGSILTSAESTGLFSVAGLDDGTYYLKETKAPAGYNLMTNLTKIVIDATTANNQAWNGTASAALTALAVKVNDGSPTAGSTSTGAVAVNVENNKGATLPATGGIGTTWLYIIGGILVIGAAVLLITKRRLGANNDK